MNRQTQKPLDVFLNILFERYAAHVPAVKKITHALIDRGVVNGQEEIVNDHIAFRTLGVPHLGISSFEKIFLHHGYRKRDNYLFEKKKLNAYWYSPPSPEYPRVFVSELLVDHLSEAAQRLIKNYTQNITIDPVDALNLDNGEEIGNFFHQPLWKLPAKQDYETLLKESEYAAWVIYNRYYLNHYTVSVSELKSGYNRLEEFNDFVESLGIRLNTEGGKIKVSKDGLLRQSSSVAEMREAVFENGEKMEIAGSYVEFAERLVLPQYASIPAEKLTSMHRREGFETGNADKIFESTYTTQTKKPKK
ncbi:MAG: DUF1338 domain-containing protein [Bergeyella sp.]|nr:DUF1338 domain-containing protein [Bergeyella sp.]